MLVSSPTWTVQPIMTSSIRSGSSPASCTARLITKAPRSAAAISLKPPPNFPIAALTAETTTTSLLFLGSINYSSFILMNGINVIRSISFFSLLPIHSLAVLLCCALMSYIQLFHRLLYRIVSHQLPLRRHKSLRQPSLAGKGRKLL